MTNEMSPQEKTNRALELLSRYDEYGNPKPKQPAVSSPPPMPSVTDVDKAMRKGSGVERDTMQKVLAAASSSSSPENTRVQQIRDEVGRVDTSPSFLASMWGKAHSIGGKVIDKTFDALDLPAEGIERGVGMLWFNEVPLAERWRAGHMAYDSIYRDVFRGQSSRDDIMASYIAKGDASLIEEKYTSDVANMLGHALLDPMWLVGGAPVVWRLLPAGSKAQKAVRFGVDFSKIDVVKDIPLIGKIGQRPIDEVIKDVTDMAHLGSTEPIYAARKYGTIRSLWHLTPGANASEDMNELISIAATVGARPGMWLDGAGDGALKTFDDIFTKESPRAFVGTNFGDVALSRTFQRAAGMAEEGMFTADNLTRMRQSSLYPTGKMVEEYAGLTPAARDTPIWKGMRAILTDDGTMPLIEKMASGAKPSSDEAVRFASYRTSMLINELIADARGPVFFFHKAEYPAWLNSADNLNAAIKTVLGLTTLNSPQFVAMNWMSNLATIITRGESITGAGSFLQPGRINKAAENFARKRGVPEELRTAGLFQNSQISETVPELAREFETVAKGSRAGRWHTLVDKIGIFIKAADRVDRGMRTTSNAVGYERGAQAATPELMKMFTEQTSDGLRAASGVMEHVRHAIEAGDDAALHTLTQAVARSEQTALPLTVAEVLNRAGVPVVEGPLYSAVESAVSAMRPATGALVPAFSGASDFDDLWKMKVGEVTEATTFWAEGSGKWKTREPRQNTFNTFIDTLSPELHKPLSLYSRSSHAGGAFIREQFEGNTQWARDAYEAGEPVRAALRKLSEDGETVLLYRGQNIIGGDRGILPERVVQSWSTHSGVSKMFTKGQRSTDPHFLRARINIDDVIVPIGQGEGELLVRAQPIPHGEAALSVDNALEWFDRSFNDNMLRAAVNYTGPLPEITADFATTPLPWQDASEWARIFDVADRAVQDLVYMGLDEGLPPLTHFDPALVIGGDHAEVSTYLSNHAGYVTGAARWRGYSRHMGQEGGEIGDPILAALDLRATAKGDTALQTLAEARAMAMRGIADVFNKYHLPSPAVAREAGGLPSFDDVTASTIRASIDGFANARAAFVDLATTQRNPLTPEEAKELTSLLVRLPSTPSDKHTVQELMSMRDLIAQKSAKAFGDVVSLNYDRKYGIDTLLQFVLPYEFWTTRTMMEWARLSLARPGYTAAFATLYNTISEINEDAGIPDRLKHNIRIPIPFLDHALGGQAGSVFFDPMRSLVPFNNYLNAPEKPDDGANGDKSAAGHIFDFAKQYSPGGVSPYMSLALGGSGVLGDRGAYVRSALGGMTRTIGPVPGPRVIMAISEYFTGMADKPDPVLLEDGLLARLQAGEAMPESTHHNIFKSIMQQTGTDGFDAYRIDRTISNMVGEDPQKWTPQAGVAALLLRKGPLYDEARRLAGREKGMRVLSGWAVMPLSLYPEGEATQRGLDSIYRSMQDDASVTPDQKTAFFKQFPEYKVRRAAMNPTTRQEDIETEYFFTDLDKVTAKYTKPITELRKAKRIAEENGALTTKEGRRRIDIIEGDIAVLLTAQDRETEVIDGLYPNRRHGLSLLASPRERALAELREKYFDIKRSDFKTNDDFFSARRAFVESIPDTTPVPAGHWYELAAGSLAEQAESAERMNRASGEARSREADRRDRVLANLTTEASKYVTRDDFSRYLGTSKEPPTSARMEYQQAVGEMQQYRAYSKITTLTPTQQRSVKKQYWETHPLLAKYYGADEPAAWSADVAAVFERMDDIWAKYYEYQSDAYRQRSYLGIHLDELNDLRRQARLPALQLTNWEPLLPGSLTGRAPSSLTQAYLNDLTSGSR